MGVISPIGNDLSQFWSSLKSGKNGISEIDLFDTEKFDVKIAGQSNIQLENFFDRKELNKLDRFSAFAILAADQAIQQSSLNESSISKNRVGVIIGSGIGGISTFETQYKKLLKSPRFVSPFFIPSMIPDIAAGHVSIKYGFKGVNYGIVSACATSNHAFGDAFKMIQSGLADAIVAGGAEAAITEMSIAGFSNMKALSKNSDKNSASRPFDKNRDGFVISGGSGMVILEEKESALKRGAKIYGTLKGFCANSDGYDMVAPSGEGAVRCMSEAISQFGQEIDYINAHGTSTPVGDIAEINAIQEVFNSQNPFLSSTKSLTGHSLGATGAQEVIYSMIMMNKGFISPSINVEAVVDEIGDINLVTEENNHKINSFMSNSFGFGGTNACLIFNKD